MSRKTGDTLRLVTKSDPHEPKVGERLRALREEIAQATPGGLSQETLSKRTHEIAATLGPTYSGIDRTTVLKFEKGPARGGLGLKHYEHRVLIARVFGLSTDDLSEYLDGRIELAEVMRRRHQRPPTSRPVIRYCDRPDWPLLVAAAREEDPLLDDATFAELGDSPVYSDAPLDSRAVAGLAGAVQRYRARRKRGQDTP